MVRRLSVSLAADSDSALVLVEGSAAELVGSRWASANLFVPGITPAEIISAT
jgi:hypothetical protein